MKYLLDANTFIDAKNHYYHMEICPGYWEWILGKFSSGDVASINEIRDELLKQKDELAAWARKHNHIFLTTSDDHTQSSYATIAEYVHYKAKTIMKPGALEDFLGGADPWLIAKAKAINATIVTLEKSNPHRTRKFYIPDICKEMGVSYMNTFELLHALKAKFILFEKEKEFA